MAESQLTNDVLRRLHSLFRSCLNFQSISPQLRQHNLITYHEWQVICNKDSHDDQVDEFLKCLPLKGRNCLNQLIECLQLSLDHAGHQDLLAELKKQVDRSNNDRQDVFEKAVSTINDVYMDQKELLLDMQTKLEKKQTEINTVKAQLEGKEKETIALKVKLDEKDEENSTKDTKLNALRKQLQEMEDSCVHVPVQETESTDDELLHDDEQNSETAHNICIEDKVKQYKEKLASYRKQCHSLKKEKEELIKTKREVENKFDQLKEELETVSRSSYGSRSRSSHGSRPRSASCSKIDFIINTDNHQQQPLEEVKSPTEWKSLFRFTRSKNTSKGTVKRSTKLDAHGDLEDTITPTSPFIIPHEDEYINPLHEGWLLKEGGKKKSIKKRWCVLLSSKYFCYFDGKEDLAKKKKPLGVVPVTEEMEIVDSLKEEQFILKSRRGEMIKSCKLDKSKAHYVQGHHIAYNLQATTADEKKKWVDKFRTVLSWDI